MRELSLFSGAGGGLLGTTLLGFTQIGYVECNEYCQKVLDQRIKDGILDRAPIFGDIRAFIREGYAESYQGMVDVVTAGFPCPAFSYAGKREGADSEQNLWPETWECIRQIKPAYAYLENVPGLLSSRVRLDTDISVPYFSSILGNLAELGYDAKWGIVSAADAGAPHLRKRLWVLAHTKSIGRNNGTPKDIRTFNRKSHPSRYGCEILADTDIGRLQERHNETKREAGSKFNRRCKRPEVADTSKERLPDIKRRKKTAQRKRKGQSCFKGWWDTEPGLGRVANGVAHRVDRLKAIGNGQVPAVVRLAWEALTHA